MEETEALRVLSALANPTRLRVFTMLAAAADPGVSSGDIAQAIGVPANLMSSHLAILQRAGLLKSTKVGRAVIYGASRNTLAELADHLAVLAGTGVCTPK
ncbi:ArsR/SmtB family transcription factor [Sphingomonas sp. PB4P5]|uniref:ArsR/SmtB family transcription factor n=1 Tax=Parasphingomonas puruogangriensis TaxID=3096155 RepID=UPI002FC7264E